MANTIMSVATPISIPNKSHSYCRTRSFDRKLISFQSSCCASSSSANGLVASLVPQTHDHTSTIARRSGNYKPSMWDSDFVENISIKHYGAGDKRLASELKTKLKMMILKNQLQEPVDQLEFIDDLQKLGISYHFEDEINQLLTTIYQKRHFDNNGGSNYNCDHHDVTNLYTEALEFRLLRQHGFKVPQEMLGCFIKTNDKRELESTSFENDTEGLLQLYEASHLLMEGEDKLEKVREFATILLQKYLDDHDHGNSIDHNLAINVRSALEQPLHWRVPRPNARRFINMYERRKDMNSTLLEFAKLDFNILQATHQQELKHVSRWWANTGLAEKLPFARDRLVECYFWTVGVLSEPQYSKLRVMSTKVNVLVTTIDDIYDIYGTLEELHLFTDVIQRWDTDSVDKLPHYMQLCFLALNNFVNEAAYDVLKDQSFVTIPHLRKSRDLCAAYLKEAEWYHNSYTPTMAEYIEVGWISISAPAILTHIFFLLPEPIEKQLVECLYSYHDTVKWSAMILRLADDLGTSTEEMQRGDVSKAVQCYMNETGASERDGEEYVRFMIRETWKKMNKDIQAGECPFPQSFVRAAMNLGRMAQYMYQHGDGHGHQDNSQTKYRIQTVLFEPIP